MLFSLKNMVSKFNYVFAQKDNMTKKRNTRHMKNDTRDYS